MSLSQHSKMSLSLITVSEPEVHHRNFIDREALWIFYCFYFVFLLRVFFTCFANTGLTPLPTNHQWEMLPSLTEYLLKHPECKIDDQRSAKCCHCGSGKVVFEALDGFDGQRFLHRCFSCKRYLFKGKNII